MLEEIKELVAESLGAEVNDLTENTNLKEDLDADSLDLFDMVSTLEDKYDVEIPAEDLENIQTIGDIVKYVESKQN